MTERILIPLDGSELALRIFEPLAPLLPGAEVTLLRVVPEWEKDAELEPATADLARAAAALAPSGVEATQRLERGDPAEVIVKLAGELSSSLVAMSTHGRSGILRLLRGSVAERVLRACPTPLFLCNPRGLEESPSPRFREILVPLDGSTTADQILPLVESWARVYGSRVTLLRVEPFIPTTPPAPIVLTNAWDEERTRASVEPQRLALEAAGIQAEVKATFGFEATEILTAAKDADLVALSTHGRSGLSRWWFGSVAESVVRHCPTPLLVVRAT